MQRGVGQTDGWKPSLSLRRLLTLLSSWNAQPWGPLYPAMVEGLADGSALYFNKSECSKKLR